MYCPIHCKSSYNLQAHSQTRWGGGWGEGIRNHTRSLMFNAFMAYFIQSYTVRFRQQAIANSAVMGTYDYDFVKSMVINS